MALALTVLGCSGTYSAPGGACSGYLVEGADTALWVDTGPGTLGRLQRHRDLAHVDAIVVTHSHPDHWTELPMVRNAFRYGLGREGVPVLAPAEVRDFADRVSTHGTGDTFDWRVVGDGDEVAVGGLALRFSRTDHPVETLAVRVDGGGDAGAHALAYTADTGPAWSLGAFAPVALALVEATFGAGPAATSHHLTAREAGLSASAAGARRLVLTHLVPGTDESAARAAAAEVFAGPVEVAEPDRRYEL